MGINYEFHMLETKPRWKYLSDPININNLSYRGRYFSKSHLEMVLPPTLAQCCTQHPTQWNPYNHSGVLIPKHWKSRNR